MATHSKICQIRAFASPHKPQNRRILWNAFPPSRSYARPLREEKAPILWVRTRTFFWRTSLLLCCGCKFRSPTPKQPYFWSTTPPNQATHSILLDNQQSHQTFPLVYQQNINFEHPTFVAGFLGTDGLEGNICSH